MMLLTFNVAGAPYALDVSGIIELVPRVGLRAVPHAPAYLAGLLGYRGEVVPVVDLGLLLGTSASSDRLSTRIILVKTGAVGDNHKEAARTIGLIAEQVIDLVPIEPEQIDRAPVQLARAPYLDAFARLDRGFVPLIAAGKLAAALGDRPSVGEPRG